MKADVRDDALNRNDADYATVQQTNSLAVVASTGAVIVAGATRDGLLQFLPPAGSSK